jgi:transposase-like protein
MNHHRDSDRDLLACPGCGREHGIVSATPSRRESFQHYFCRCCGWQWDALLSIVDSHFMAEHKAKNPPI